MQVPFLDVGASYSQLKSEIDDAYHRVMRSGTFVLGEELELFEREFAKCCGATGARGVGSGFDALSLALRAVGVEPGDEVIVPSFTFIATWLSVSAIGAVPVAAEPDERTACLTPESAQGAITERTRAIVPVHLYGLPVDIDGFSKLAAETSNFLVFDAAQAHGAEWRGVAVGAFGDASAWSFYPSKNLGAFGDSGAVTFSDPGIGRRLESLRNYGSTDKYLHVEKGTNSRLDELQAAFLRAKLPHLRDWNKRRVQIASRYIAEFAELPISLPELSVDRASSWHLFAVMTERRDELRQYLDERGVQALIHYPMPPHRQPAYRDSALGPFPVADRLSRQTLSLPIGPHLTDEQVNRVVSAVTSFQW